MRRHRSPGRSRFNVQRQEGDSYFVKTRRWHTLTRVVDRVRNWYYEHIEDAETAEVVRHVEEPLDEHRRFGRARG
jgi:hypothetical protein